MESDAMTRMAGMMGCQIIDSAGTYTTAGSTLISNVTSIEVVTGAAAAITALTMTGRDGSAVSLAAVHNIVNADLSDFAGKIITLAFPISSITVASGVKLIVYAG